MPVGPPGQNYHFLLLDNRFQPVPLGAVGELYIGGIVDKFKINMEGDAVAIGYLNRPELNEEKFLDVIPGKWFEQYKASSKLNCRWYRTGDLLRWLDNCTLEFIGR